MNVIHCCTVGLIYILAEYIQNLRYCFLVLVFKYRSVFNRNDEMPVMLYIFTLL